MSGLPEGYQIGKTERSYLRRLEDFRRKGMALTPSDFCREVGLAGTSSIRRYQALKLALNQYGWQTAPERMRGNPRILALLDLGQDPEIGRLNSKVERLQQRLEKFRVVEARLAERDKELDQLRGIMMSFAAHFAGENSHRARDIEERLMILLQEALGETHFWSHPPGEGIARVLVDKLLDEMHEGHEES